MKQLTFLSILFLSIHLPMAAQLLEVQELTTGTWPINSDYSFIGVNTLDQAVQGNYALLFKHTGSSTGRTYINSPADIRFRINSEEKMILHNSGRVGIGTTVPNNLLDVRGQTSVHMHSTTTNPHLRLRETVFNDYSRLTFENTFTPQYWTLASRNSPTSTDLFNLFHSSYGNIMTATQDGNIGINTTNPLAKFHILQASDGLSEGVRWTYIDGLNERFDWDIYVTFSGLFMFTFNGIEKSYINFNGEYNEVSDRRLKKDILRLNPVLAKVNKMQPSTYRFVNNSDNVGASVGFIAQEVEKYFPELVSENNGYKALAYGKFGVLAIKAIQEQQEIIERQEKKINDQFDMLLLHEDKLKTLMYQLKLVESFVYELTGKKNSTNY